jgi:hypothetical protein
MKMVLVVASFVSGSDKIWQTKLHLRKKAVAKKKARAVLPWLPTLYLPRYFAVNNIVSSQAQ